MTSPRSASIALAAVLGFPALAGAQAQPLTDPSAARAACEQASDDSYETEPSMPQQIVEYSSDNSGACVFLDPMAFSREEYTSHGSPDALVRNYSGWFYNSHTDQELVCRVDLVASYARVSTMSSSEEGVSDYSVACDAPELQRTKRQTLNFLRLPAGGVANVSALVADGKLAENDLVLPNWVRCGVGGYGVSCKANPCRDELNRYAEIGAIYATGEPGKPRSDGARCARLKCVGEQETGDVRPEGVDSGYFVAGECRPFNGCYFNGVDHAIGSSRNDDTVVIHDGTAPALAAQNARCDIRRVETVCKNPGPSWEPQGPYLTLRDGYWHKDTRTCQSAPDAQCYVGSKIYQPGNHVIGSGECRCGESYDKMLRCNNGAYSFYNSRPCPTRGTFCP